jgi:phage terminase Nu1 subunit (DNA packaging protein)
MEWNQAEYNAERTRLTKEQADLTALKRQELERSMVPCVLVERVVNGLLAGLAQKISYLEIPDVKKQEILADLQAIPIDDYFTNALRDIEADADSSSPAA